MYYFFLSRHIISINLFERKLYITTVKAKPEALAKGNCTNKHKTMLLNLS